jgi:hypothetical protein
LPRAGRDRAKVAVSSNWMIQEAKAKRSEAKAKAKAKRSVFVAGEEICRKRELFGVANGALLKALCLTSAALSAFSRLT